MQLQRMEVLCGLEDTSRPRSCFVQTPGSVYSYRSSETHSLNALKIQANLKVAEDANVAQTMRRENLTRHERWSLEGDPVKRRIVMGRLVIICGNDRTNVAIEER
ncbi:hypothetical protein Mapa_004383 [Marchantia paleacea]|nr:hypothetical protein Mapa_004383 [Marchantia paleacea]